MAKKENKKLTKKTEQIEEISLDDLDLSFWQETKKIIEKSKKEEKPKKEHTYREFDEFDELDRVSEFDEFDDFEDDMFEENEEPTDEDLEELELEELDDDIDSLDHISFTEDWEEIAFALQKERWLSKLPKDRSEDKRRIWKGIQKFIDTEVPEKMLEWMPERIQELMKKWKINWAVTQDEIMTAIPNMEEDIDLLDDIYSRFIQLNIDIVDNMDKENLFKSERKN